MKMLKDRKGVVLIVAMAVMVFFAALGIVASTLFATESRIAMNMLSSTKAFFLSESGVKYYIKSTLSEDSDWSDNTGTTGSMAGGSFQITTSNASTNSITLECTGSLVIDGVTIPRKLRYNAVRASAGAFSGDYVFYGGSPGGDGDVFFDHINNGTIIGDIFIKGDFDAQFATNLEIDGAIAEYQEDAAIPDVDWTHWETNADYVLSGDQTFDGTSYEGVYYVDGNVILNNNNMEFTGTVIATGNITCIHDNNVTITAADGQPALLAGGDITIEQGNNMIITGATYAGGDINFGHSNNMTIEGPVVFGDDFLSDQTNNITIDATDFESIIEGFTGDEWEVEIDLGSFEEVA